MRGAAGPPRRRRGPPAWARRGGSAPTAAWQSFAEQAAGLSDPVAEANDGGADQRVTFTQLLLDGGDRPDVTPIPDDLQSLPDLDAMLQQLGDVPADIPDLSATAPEQPDEQTRDERADQSAPQLPVSTGQTAVAACGPSKAAPQPGLDPAVLPAPQYEQQHSGRDLPCPGALVLPQPDDVQSDETQFTIMPRGESFVAPDSGALVVFGNGGSEMAPAQQLPPKPTERVVRRERRAAGRVIIPQLTLGPEEASPTLVGQVSLLLFILGPHPVLSYCYLRLCAMIRKQSCRCEQSNRPWSKRTGPAQNKVLLRTTASKLRTLSLQVGGMFALYCLYQTQPGRERVYLPLPVLECITDIVPRLHAEAMHGTCSGDDRIDVPTGCDKLPVSRDLERKGRRPCMVSSYQLHGPCTDALCREASCSLLRNALNLVLNRSEPEGGINYCWYVADRRRSGSAGENACGRRLRGRRAAAPAVRVGARALRQLTACPTRRDRRRGQGGAGGARGQVPHQQHAAGACP